MKFEFQLDLEELRTNFRVWVCPAVKPGSQQNKTKWHHAWLLVWWLWQPGRQEEGENGRRQEGCQPGSLDAKGAAGGLRNSRNLCGPGEWGRQWGGGKSPGCLRAEWVGSLLSFPKGWGKIFQVKSKFSGAVIYYFRTLFSTKLIQNCILVEKLCSASCMFWQFENELCVFTRKLWEGVDIHWKCFSFIHPFDLFIFPAELTSICVFVPSEMQIWAFWDCVRSLLCLMQWDLDPESLIVEQYHLWQYFR